MKILFELTKEDILHGKANDCNECPFALSVKRTLGDNKIKIRSHKITKVSFIEFNRHLTQYHKNIILPEKVHNAITLVDHLKKDLVSPFTFVLEVPKEMVKYCEE